MVAGWARRLITISIIGSALVLFYLALVPQLIHTTGEPYGRLVRDALGAYHEIHGKYPAALQEIDPLLNAGAGIDCVTKSISENTYEVTIRSGLVLVCVLEVAYSASADGTLEKYDVRILDNRACN
jgi:hypothetical protein